MFVLFPRSILSDVQLTAITHGVHPFIIDDGNIQAFYTLWGNEDPESDMTGNGFNATDNAAARFTPNPPVELLENYL